MSRRARPSARTTRTAPTAPCVPVTRDGARVPRSVPRAAGPVTGNGSCTSVEGGPERSTGSPGGPRGTPRTDGRPDGRPGPGISRGVAIAVGLLLALAALAVYSVTYVDRYYDHFVWQAAAFLEGQAAIRYPVEAAGGLLGNARFQDVLPIATTDGVARGAPAVPAAAGARARCRSSRSGASRSTTRRSSSSSPRSTSRSAGGRSAGCRSASSSASRTTIFFAFGTVFWYTAQISTTWYQAHIVAVGLTFLASASRSAPIPRSAEDEPDEHRRRRRRDEAAVEAPDGAGRSASSRASSSPGSCSGSPPRRA